MILPMRIVFNMKANKLKVDGNKKPQKDPKEKLIQSETD